MNKRTWLNFYILSHLSLFSRTVTRRWRHSGNTPRRERKSAVLEVCFTAIVGHTADAFIQSLLSSSSKSSQRFIFSLGSRTSEISFEYQPIYVFITFTHSRCKYEAFMNFCFANTESIFAQIYHTGGNRRPMKRDRPFTLSMWIL